MNTKHKQAIFDEAMTQASVELASVEAQIASIQPLQRRAEQLRQFIELSKQLGMSAPLPSVQQVGKWADLKSDVPLASATNSKPKRKKDQALDAAEKVILEYGPMITRPMVQKLEHMGVPISGSNEKAKIGALSALLSKSDRFKSDRSAGGWVLVQPALTGLRSDISAS